MARTIGVVCTLIVALQILVGVPLVVCLVFYCLTLGQISVDVKADQEAAIVQEAAIPAHSPAVAITPPANAIPAVPDLPSDNAILQSRAAVGSPLAGTVLETSNFAEEQTTFVAAFEKAASEHTLPLIAPADACPTSSISTDLAHLGHNQTIVQHLYQMADLDEQAGQYPRADQWRALAREIRAEQTPAAEPSEEVAISPEGATITH